MLMISDCD